MNFKNRINPTFARVLYIIDFDVPRRETPLSTYFNSDRRKERPTLTTLEQERWERAREFCPIWFKDPWNHFLDELDRLVLISSHDLGERNAQIVTFNPSQFTDDGCYTTLIFEDGEYELITDWDVSPKPKSERRSKHEIIKERGYYLPTLGEGSVDSHNDLDFQEMFPTAEHGLALKDLSRPSPKAEARRLYKERRASQLSSV